MRYLGLLILFALPQLHYCQFDWKVEQPVSYVIYNGKYYRNPTENSKPLEEDASSSSFLDGLNPLNIFSTIWESLPSLDFFGSRDHIDEESDFTSGNPDDASLGQNEYQKAQHGAKYSYVPSHQSVGGNGLFSGSPMPLKPDLPFDLDSIPAHPANPFKYNLRKRRSLRTNPQQTRDFRNTLTFYKPLGQGSYMKYDIQPEDGHVNEAGKERRRPIPSARPLSPFRPLKKPLSPYRIRPLWKKSKPMYSQTMERLDDSESTTTSTTTTTEDPFPCPKFGNWSYDGEMCVALGPIPKWACKPKDLLSSGKLAICRNKVYLR